MRPHSQWKKLFIAVPTWLAVFLLVVPTNRIGATGPSTPLFLPVVAYGSGGAIADAVAVADLNGDGKPDLAVANQCAIGGCPNGPGGVAVLLGNGDGTFQAAVSYGSGGFYPGSVAIGDVNGDGKPDLVVTQCPNFNCQGNGSIGVLLGIGDGTFQLAVSYDSGGYLATSIAVADVDGDGKPDLVVANCTSSGLSCGYAIGAIGILLGNGDGTFKPTATYGSGGIFARSIATADVNGDGIPDLVVANQCASAGCGSGSGGASVLLANGDGTFQAAVTYDSGGVAFSVLIADVNGDGKPDLVLANLCSSLNSCGTGTVAVLRGNGDGTFQAATNYASDINEYRSVAAADVDSDGKTDLLVAGYGASTSSTTEGAVDVLLGNGDGTFQPAVTYDSGGLSAVSVAVEDVNKDGRPDVLVANTHLCDPQCDEGTIGVLLNNSPFCTTSPVITLSTTPTSLWPPNGKMVPVSVSGMITNPGCTLKTATYAVTDEYGEVQPSGPVKLGPEGAYSFNVSLQALRLGADIDGRLYTITVSASSDAGKIGSRASTVIVPHDQRH